MAEDSTSMLTVVLYNSPAPDEAPMAFRIFLLCRVSRVTSMVVRRQLRKVETAKYGAPKWTIASMVRVIGFVGRPVS